LGDGTLEIKLESVRISTASDWVAVSAGDSHSLALNRNGEIYDRGNNVNGQLGDGYPKLNSLVFILSGM
jgi:alpha-tubulin suppressor-like RCC1 family protein